MRLFLIAAALLMALPRYSDASEFGMAGVYVASAPKDSVGSRMIYAFRETIRRSSMMELVPNASDATYVIDVATLDPFESTDTAASGRSTIYSVVWTVRFNQGGLTYWAHSVGACDTSRRNVNECGERLAADTERVVSSVRAAL